ncbi:MAG TPA: hypothetical protein VJP58_10270 [Candidatus Nitrosocosmicus sp.]|nr:hypothetical protein [Candidatus Nitrosocosmicus sp.]
MKFFLDLTFVPGPQRNEILSAISVISNIPINSPEINFKELPQYVEFEFSGSLIDFEDILRTSLERISYLDYIVTQDSLKENTLTLLKTGDLEQLDIYFCDFCGSFFNSEEGKYIHERAHYLY